MNWQLHQLRRMARIRNGAGHSEVEDPNGQVPVYGSGGEFARATRALYNGPAVLLGRKGTIDRPLLVNGEFWTVDTMFCALPLAGTEPRFLYYACTTIPFGMLSTNTALPSMTQGDLNATRIPHPPFVDQQLIADFLDRETAKIDALIGKQEQLIATLREDRIATITHAVTKGLDPNAEMKDSGGEWLGEIPAGWSIRPFLRCVENRVDYRGATPKKVHDGILLVTARNVRSGWIDYEGSQEFVSAEEYDDIMRRGVPAIDDLLLTMEAPLGNAALVDRTDVALAQRVIKFRPDSLVVSPKYLLYSVLGQGFQSQLVSRATGSTALGLKASKLCELKVVVPDLHAQSAIVNYLDNRWTAIDVLTAKSEQMIGVLREYRSALITDAVTGKIDVRGAA